MEMFNILAGFTVGIFGGYFMYRGKKTQNVKMMVWGGVLVVLSYYAFSWGGGDDKDTNDVLKKMIPVTTPGQAPPEPQQP